MEIPDMGEPPVFWVRSMTMTCIMRRCNTSGVARWNWALVASTSALGWNWLMMRSNFSKSLAEVTIELLPLFMLDDFYIARLLNCMGPPLPRCDLFLAVPPLPRPEGTALESPAARELVPPAELFETCELGPPLVWPFEAERLITPIRPEANRYSDVFRFGDS